MSLQHITEFIPTGSNLLRVGDVWDDLSKEARAAILMLTGAAWVGASGRWIEIPAQARIEIAHGVYLFKDLINRVLP